MKSAKTYNRRKTTQRRYVKKQRNASKKRKQQQVKRYKIKIGGNASNPEDLSKAANYLNGMVHGIAADIKNVIAQRAASLFRGNVTARVDVQFLSKLPDMFRKRILNIIDMASYKVIRDGVIKGASVGENMIKSIPGAGNVISLAVAGDKAYAMAKNMLDGVNMVRDEILNMKRELTELGLDPDEYLPIYIPPVPTIPRLKMPFLTPGDDPFNDEIDRVMLSSKTGGGQSSHTYMKCIKYPGASTNACQDILQRTGTSIESFRGGGEQNKNTHIQCTQHPDGSSECHDILQRTHASIYEFHGGGN